MATMKTVKIEGRQYTLDREYLLFGANLSPYDEITIQGNKYLYQFVEYSRPKRVVLYTAPKREVDDMDYWMDRHIVGVFKAVTKRK